IRSSSSLRSPPTSLHTGEADRDAWTKRSHSPATLAAADRLDRRAGAAPLARRLAARVGSRIALPRSFAGRMGQIEPASQTRSRPAQLGRVLGRAGIAAE